MLEPLSITRGNSHRTVQRKALEVGTQRSLHERLVACATTHANITLASTFARQRHALHRCGIQLEQQLLPNIAAARHIRIACVRILWPLAHLPQLASHTITHAAHQQGNICVRDLRVPAPLQPTTT
ncbi:MAG: hypothetical protein ACJAYX_003254 [Planctomycetota bacterium]|jgi:hypothetical protein